MKYTSWQQMIKLLTSVGLVIIFPHIGWQSPDNPEQARVKGETKRHGPGVITSRQGYITTYSRGRIHLETQTQGFPL
jgi:hypothetical protein